MNLVFGLTVSLMLMAGGVWANVNHGGPLSHSQAAWVSREGARETKRSR